MVNPRKYNKRNNFSITKETTLEIVQETHKILGVDYTKRGKFIISRPVKLRKNYNFIFRAKSPNLNEKDSSLISIYQCGLLNDKEIQYLKILHPFLQEKFYDQLRTKETFGYIVSLVLSESAGAYCLLAVVQSNSKIPEVCSERVRRFIKESFQKIKDISDSEFKKYIDSRLVTENKKDTNLNESFLRNWDEICKNRYKFDIKEKNCEILKNCTKTEFIEFYEKYLINEPCVLDSEFLCEAHYEENEKMMKEKKILDDEKFEKRVICDEIEDFRACNELFPIYDNALYLSLNSS